MTRWRVRAGVLVAVVLFSSCGVVRGLLGTERALKREGFRNADLNIERTDGLDLVTVTYRGRRGGDGGAADAQAAARVIWQQLPLRFDDLFIEGNGPGGGRTATFTYGQLREQLGPRPVRERSLGKEVSRTGRRVALGLAVAGLALIIFFVVIIVLVTRAASRRRRRQPPAGWPPPPGWGQPPGPTPS